ncbi:MAG: M48 family metallopeptidase [Pseudomonadota bacterium]|nr:M48 family metallopeptidase [Pseudomonadota bacterium]
MSMAEHHAELVARLQVQARQAPRLYLCKLGLLALAGYALLLALLALSLGVPVFVLMQVVVGGVPAEPRFALVVLLPGAFGVALLRALWIRFAPPPGYRLEADEAPLLQAEVERLRKAADAPVLDGIIIDSHLNAAASDVPRAFGLLGHRHFLVLGFPLLQMLDRAELAAVVAHEFGHFGKGHGQFGGWIYRVRLSWLRVMEGLSGGGLPGYVLARFFSWYAPYFNAYSFVLARDNEYSADADAARTAGAASLASALVRMELATRRLQCDPARGLIGQAKVVGHPPAGMLADLARRMDDARPCNLQRLIEVAGAEADPHDTHPTLPQRLKALGVEPIAPHRVQSAAVVLLGTRADDIERHLDAQWRDEVRLRWREIYDAAASDRARLAALESQAQSTPQELLERARLVESLRGDTDALPLYTQVIDALPDHAFAHYRSGLLRVQAGEHEAGVAQLQRSIAIDPGAVPPILLTLDRLAGDPDLTPEATGAVAGFHAEVRRRAGALQARDGVDAGDQYQQHGLDETCLAGLEEIFAQSPRVAHAWLARKPAAFAGDAAHYVILVDWRGSVVSEAAGLRQLSDAFELPGSFTVFTDSGRRDAARRVKQACKAPVYRRRDRRFGAQR